MAPYQSFRPTKPLCVGLNRILNIPSRLLRYTFTLRCSIAQYFYPIHRTPYSQRILRQFDPFTFAKRSRYDAVSREAETLIFDSRCTILVPSVFDVFVDKSDPEYGWLFMEYILGVRLDTAWPQMNESQRQSIMLQLGDM